MGSRRIRHEDRGREEGGDKGDQTADHVVTGRAVQTPRGEADDEDEHMWTRGLPGEQGSIEMRVRWRRDER